MRRLVAALEAGRDLAEQEAAALAEQAVEGALDPAVARALAEALARRGPTGSELRGLARVLRERAVRPPIGARGAPLVEVAGPGPQWTEGALLAAAAGARVVQQGGEGAVPGRPLPLAEDPLDEPGEAARLLARTGFTCLYAPRFHPALMAVAGSDAVARLLLPLIDPCRPHHLVLGAASPAEGQALVDALAGMHLERAVVVQEEGGRWRRRQVRPGGVAEGGLEAPPGEVEIAALVLEVCGLAGTREEAERQARAAQEDGRAARTRAAVAAG